MFPFLGLDRDCVRKLIWHVRVIQHLFRKFFEFEIIKYFRERTSLFIRQVIHLKILSDSQPGEPTGAFKFYPFDLHFASLSFGRRSSEQAEQSLQAATATGIWRRRRSTDRKTNFCPTLLNSLLFNTARSK